MKSHLKLGTRKSLLAWAQSSWVARQIERLNPGCSVELVGIETRGDRILDVSLQSVEGKEFFVAELDDALRAGRVDLTVHSMKDLSLERPAEFMTGAVPRRENPRDAVLFGPGVFDKIAAGKTLKIGTSSPRRLENIPPFLSRALPRVSGVSPKIELTEIRGNVNTRLARVHEPEGSERQLDGVVLAFAGLIRLAADETGWNELQKLLDGVRWMILPLRECPAAPAQGALAIECRKDDSTVRSMLLKLHDGKTAEAVNSERELLALWGGGCHQRFGATSVLAPDTGPLLHIRGVKPDGEFVDELRWKTPMLASGHRIAWNGNEWRKASESNTEQLPVDPGMFMSAPLFIAHSRAFPEKFPEEALTGLPSVWTSGVPSWFRLAERGVWVCGCAEGLGFDEIASTITEKVLRLPPLSDWYALTHESAVPGWRTARAVGTYRLPKDARSEVKVEAQVALKSATHIFWSSGSQFEQLGKFAAAGASHACGPGKTASHLRNAGVNPLVFPSPQEWTKWLKS